MSRAVNKRLSVVKTFR